MTPPEEPSAVDRLLALVGRIAFALESIAESSERIATALEETNEEEEE